MMAMPTATTVALRKKARRGAAGCCSGVVSEVMRLLFCSSARGRMVLIGSSGWTDLGYDLW
jgi:hypothetical protein